MSGITILVKTRRGNTSGVSFGHFGNLGSSRCSVKESFLSNFIETKGKEIMTFKFVLKSLELSLWKFKLCIFHPNMLSGLSHMCTGTHMHDLNLSRCICLIHQNENRIAHTKKTESCLNITHTIKKQENCHIDKILCKFTSFFGNVPK